MSQNVDQIRQKIDAMHAQLGRKNYYELLNVEPNATSAIVSAKFRELVKRWHIDRFSNLGLGDAEQRKVKEIFAAINAAHKTLSNENERLEYDLEISDGPDIGAILEAERLFREGNNFLRRGSYKGAHEKFKQALSLKDDEIEYRAYTIYTEFLLIPKDADGVVIDKKRPMEIFTELDEIAKGFSSEKDWMLYFLGVTSLGLGRTRQAEGLFTETLMANSQHHDAQRQLRLLRSRRTKGASKKGFFAKLFKK